MIESNSIPALTNREQDLLAQLRDATRQIGEAADLIRDLRQSVELHRHNNTVVRSDKGMAHCDAQLQRIDAFLVGKLPDASSALSQHPDDEAIDRFANAMKSKMSKSRAKGRGGWDDPLTPPALLARMLVEHLMKGNQGTFEDVANFAMMLHQRNAEPILLATQASDYFSQEPDTAWSDEDTEEHTHRNYIELQKRYDELQTKYKLLKDLI